MLTNPYYVGVVVYRGVYYPGKHEPLISHRLYERVQLTLDAHNQAGERQYRHNHYLKGSVYCGTCKSRLAARRVLAQPKRQSIRLLLLSGKTAQS